ncbi:hypothetical protein [Pseudomonas phage vB_PaeM_RP7]|uniref:Uncharacterized protein n=1 Tax=Pseudomonas phage PAP-JP TaxID=2583508 RepID=A0A5C1K4R7_9CAUD|nr:hypothetical protein PAPJP_116 [Pseudomonas phage PAP-JP]UKH48024.1 MAG: hypothetical protein [Pseudomonas phage RP4]WAB56701.1 hypothetical protein [Pseudomonas phage vB_PaeM_RP15]WAB56987.1 hypothetical protein [Pseudomonas phage vB_PaeM_RP6]WAB57104.1 hypothetical protein [Pseudomonas phage vB_PaeM_RP7]WAB57241.1 hypothetical protein [Pseudomonas phage vB_PaeM_RP8]WAB57497.1 hypothetical protein [Pseudomonas phage vB_PaeM_RP9]WAB57614.1 hypothetical protein [Pseudomonas phage vB_PaeM_R
MEMGDYVWKELAPEVKEGLLALVKWKDEGFTEHPCFDRRVRLCKNVASFLEYKGMRRVESMALVINSMSGLFLAEGFKKGAYPFEKGKGDLQPMIYTNPHRLEFIETCRRKLA